MSNKRSSDISSSKQSDKDNPMRSTYVISSSSTISTSTTPSTISTSTTPSTTALSTTPPSSLEEIKVVLNEIVQQQKQNNFLMGKLIAQNEMLLKYLIKDDEVMKNEINQVKNEDLTLNGLRQHYVKLRAAEKNRKIINLLDILKFNQAVIFVNSAARSSVLCELLKQLAYSVVEIHRGMQQEERMARYKEYKEFPRDILVATNLFGHGMDVERVNIVFNYDMPENAYTYLHRVGRVDRIGTKGLAITFVADEDDATILNEIQSCFKVQITEIPNEIDVATYMENC